MDANGTTYGPGTPAAVVEILERARASRARLRLFYGDAATGKAWPEEYDTLGTIGRSSGSIKVPLLIRNARSTGGGMISTESIVAIATAPGKFAYRHQAFGVGTFTIEPADLPDYVETVRHNGEIHARFKRPGQAARFVAYMRGERFAK